MIICVYLKLIMNNPKIDSWKLTVKIKMDLTYPTDGRNTLKKTEKKFWIYAMMRHTLLLVANGECQRRKRQMNYYANVLGK